MPLTTGLSNQLTTPTRISRSIHFSKIKEVLGTTFFRVLVEELIPLGDRGSVLPTMFQAIVAVVRPVTSHVHDGRVERLAGVTPILLDDDRVVIAVDVDRDVVGEGGGTKQ